MKKEIKLNYKFKIKLKVKSKEKLKKIIEIPAISRQLFGCFCVGLKIRLKGVKYCEEFH